MSVTKETNYWHYLYHTKAEQSKGNNPPELNEGPVKLILAPQKIAPTKLGIAVSKSTDSAKEKCKFFIRVDKYSVLYKEQPKLMETLMYIHHWGFLPSAEKRIKFFNENCHVHLK